MNACMSEITMLISLLRAKQLNSLTPLIRLRRQRERKPEPGYC
jgi:hypothetical protein